MPHRQQFFGDGRSEADRSKQTPQVLIARGELSSDDKGLLTRLLGRLGLETEYVDQETFLARERKVEELKAALARATMKGASEAETSAYRFADITSPDQYIVREHLEDIKDQVAMSRFVGYTFNYLVDANGPGHTWSYRQFVDVDSTRRSQTIGNKIFREPVPPSKAVVKARTEIGIQPYEGNLDHMGRNSLGGLYAIQAGSIIEVAKDLEQLPSENLNVAKRGVLLVGAMLQQQFDQ